MIAYYTAKMRMVIDTIGQCVRACVENLRLEQNLADQQRCGFAYEIMSYDNRETM